MVSNAEINHEASKITQQAELGRQSDLQHVNHELHNDMKNYSASDYNKLLNGIKQQNGADVNANSHLPNLELYDSSKSSVPDSVKANYSDGTSMTANGQQNTDNVGSAAPQSAHGAGDGSIGAGGASAPGGSSDSISGRSSHHPAAPGNDSPPPPPGSGRGGSGPGTGGGQGAGHPAGGPPGG